MATIGFIGLGTMGFPMACNLARAGFDVRGYSRRPTVAAALAEQGGHNAPSIAEAVSSAEIVATMLPDSPDVEEVLAGSGGVYEHAAPNTLVIDFSSIQPRVAAALAEKGRKRGLRVLDAPVSGGEHGARDGSLSVMVGGDEGDFEAARDVLTAVGETIVHVGPPGSGQTVKAANQLIVAGTIQLVSEAMVLLEALNVEVEPALRVMAGGLAGNAIIDRKSSSMLARNFRPGFKLELHNKDMRIVLDAAQAAGVVVPLGSVVAQLISSLTLQGYGRLDHTALLALTELMSGRRRLVPREPM